MDVQYRSRCTYCYPCTRLSHLKFELTNQNSAGNKKSIEVGATFLTGNGIKYSRKGIHNSKNLTRLQKVKHFEPPSFYFGINVARLTVLLVLLEPFYLDSYIVETEGSFTAGERTYLIAELLHAEVARAEPHNRRESFEDKCYQPSAFLFGCPTDRY